MGSYSEILIRSFAISFSSYNMVLQYLFTESREGFDDSTTVLLHTSFSASNFSVHFIPKKDFAPNFLG